MRPRDIGQRSRVLGNEVDHILARRHDDGRERHTLVAHDALLEEQPRAAAIFAADQHHLAHIAAQRLPVEHAPLVEIAQLHQRQLIHVIARVNDDGDPVEADGCAHQLLVARRRGTTRCRVGREECAGDDVVAPAADRLLAQRAAATADGKENVGMLARVLLGQVAEHRPHGRRAADGDRHRRWRGDGGALAACGHQRQHARKQGQEERSHRTNESVIVSRPTTRQ